MRHPPANALTTIEVAIGDQGQQPARKRVLVEFAKRPLAEGHAEPIGVTIVLTHEDVILEDEREVSRHFIARHALNRLTLLRMTVSIETQTDEQG